MTKWTAHHDANGNYIQDENGNTIACVYEMAAAPMICAAPELLLVLSELVGTKGPLSSTLFLRAIAAISRARGDIT